MRSIWVRAGVGALAVFALGMMLYTAVRTTKAKARQALMEFKSELDSGSAVGFGHLDRAIPFIVDGRTLGQLTSLTLNPGEGGTPALRALVTLDRDHLDPAMLSSCDLVPLSPDKFEVSQGFRCATPADRGLRSLGEVRFEPVGVVRPVRADKAALAATPAARHRHHRLVASRGGPCQRHRRQRRACKHQCRQQRRVHSRQRRQGQGGAGAGGQERVGGEGGLDRHPVGRGSSGFTQGRTSGPPLRRSCRA